MEYKINAPNEIEITETKVPIHFPNKTPEIINKGEPKPSSKIHTTEKIKTNTNIIA